MCEGSVAGICCTAHLSTPDGTRKGMIYTNPDLCTCTSTTHYDGFGGDLTRTSL